MEELLPAGFAFMVQLGLSSSCRGGSFSNEILLLLFSLTLLWLDVAAIISSVGGFPSPVKNLQCNILVISLDKILYHQKLKHGSRFIERFSTTASSDHWLVGLSSPVQNLHYCNRVFTSFLHYVSGEHCSKQEVLNNCFVYSIVGNFSSPIKNSHFILVSISFLH